VFLGTHDASADTCRKTCRMYGRLRMGRGAGCPPMFHLGFSGIGEMILAAPPEARAYRPPPCLCRFPAGSRHPIQKRVPRLGRDPESLHDGEEAYFAALVGVVEARALEDDARALKDVSCLSSALGTVTLGWCSWGARPRSGCHSWDIDSRNVPLFQSSGE